MLDTKSLFTSRTAWGGVVTVASALAAIWGIDISAAEQAQAIDLVDKAVLSVTAIVGFAGVIWGRIKAAKKIG